MRLFKLFHDHDSVESRQLLVLFCLQLAYSSVFFINSGNKAMYVSNASWPIQHSNSSIPSRPKKFMFSQQLKDSAYACCVYTASLAEYSSAIFTLTASTSQFIQPKLLSTTSTFSLCRQPRHSIALCVSKSGIAFLSKRVLYPLLYL